MRNAIRCLPLCIGILLALPPQAPALEPVRTVCRDAIAKAVIRHAVATAKVVARCHHRRSAAIVPLEVDCNDAGQADLDGKLAAARARTAVSISSRCGSLQALDGYDSCPDPAATSDDGGATDGIDDATELAACALALAEARVGLAAADAQGNPSDYLVEPLRKCQGRSGKAAARLMQTVLGEGRRCQRRIDGSGGDGSYACQGVDSRARIAKAADRLPSKVVPACSFPPDALSHLAACAEDVDTLAACAAASAEHHAAALIHAAYGMSGDPSTTTTTTMPSVTTTTLPGTGEECGGSAPQCDGTCPAGSACVSAGESCNCVAFGSGPCAPATIRRIIHSKYSSDESRTFLSTGWSGSAHDIDVPDGTGDTIDVTCDEQCENCAITLNVQAGSPTSNCRCTSNPRTSCTVINGSDPESCGSLDPLCRCYFGAPLPISSGGSPACVVNRIRENYNGTMNLRSGEWNDRIRLAAVVHLGIDQVKPCPVCVGDPVPNDGVRGGTCSGGLSSGSCDANGVHATFGATSLDCLPAAAANISGNGLLINLKPTTSEQVVVAELPCDTPSGASCHCRTCTGNGALGCTSDAECAAAGAGVCTAAGGAGVRQNQCTGFLCDESGFCANGPWITYCDGVLHPDGRGFIPCASDGDCSATDSGACTVVELKRCFPDPLVTDGIPGTWQPTTASPFCVAATSNPAINLAAGLPGPGALALTFTADIRCQNDPSLVYEFPSGANCDDGSATTTTTLLPLPACEDAESPVCGGLCPLGQSCVDDGGACACTGLPLPTCEDSAAPVCGGLCAQQDRICLDNGGTCECVIPTLPQCADADAPVCGGLCPLGEVCTDAGGTCECGAPGLPPCGSALAPTCAGLCDVGEACVAQGDVCGCLDLGLPTCAESDAPLCGGTCALGSLCTDVGGSCQCTTLPLP